jgi:hypothetical protein
VVVRIGMGYKALFAANSLGYWQEKQRRRPPESVLPQSARSYAEHPERSIAAIDGYGRHRTGNAAGSLFQVIF